jgi:hypothetical protein
MTANRKGYDSTSATDCPNDGAIYGGYVDGTISSNYHDQLTLHPDSTVFSIGRHTTSRADFYDVEAGLLSPTEGVSLAHGNLLRGEFAGIYVQASSYPLVESALKPLGILGQVKIWVAHEHDGDDTIPDFAVGRQYLLSPGLSPGHYDVSSWLPFIEGLDPAPLVTGPATLPFLYRHRLNRLDRLTKNLDAMGQATTTPLAVRAKNRLKLADSRMAALSVTNKTLIHRQPPTPQ